MDLVEREEKYRREQEELYQELRENPIDLDALFQTVVKAVHYDYVGFESKRRYFMPGEYHTYVFSRYRFGSLTMETLVRSLHQFAGDMHDRRLRFYCDDWIDYRNLAMKYRVRAGADCLYVTSAAPKTGLRAGDRILAVHRMSPQNVRAFLRKTAFYSDVWERELWGGYLRMAQSLEIEHEDGSREHKKMDLFPAEKEEYPICFQNLKDKTTYLRLERMDRAAMEALLAAHEEEIARSKKLILDLRRSVGGEEDACEALFPYLVDREYRRSELLQDEGSYVLFTKNNCDRRYGTLAAFRERLTDAQEIALIEEEMDIYRKNYGKGLLYQPPRQEEQEWIVPASASPEKVVLLTDTFCELESEQFAAMCQRCGSKVTTLGRPTMGTLDFYDCIRLKVHEHMTLSYPIRMSKAAYEGRGISEKGLPVDRYIPWTPREIQEDVLLNRALEI